MNVGDLAGLRLSRGVLDEETKQHRQAVDIGLELHHFVPQGWRHLPALDRVVLPSKSGRWIQEMYRCGPRSPWIGTDECCIRPIGHVVVDAMTSHFVILSPNGGMVSDCR